MKNLLLAACLMLLGASAFAQITIVPNIDKVEYFWGQDPGLGNGVQVDVPDGTLFDGSVTIDPTSLPAGLHILGIRAHTEDGLWGIPQYRTFNVHQIEAAEYFWNVDPGVGNGIPVAINTTELSIDEDLTVSTEGFRPGPALLGFRWKLKGGSWGPTTYRGLNISTRFTEGEYFWDNDPGVGSATSFVLPPDEDYTSADIEIDNNGLISGYHNLYIRTRGLNGSFGITKKTRIYITREIVSGEYFWDTDPGVGNGQTIPAFSTGASAVVCGDIVTDGLTDGEHYLYTRTVTEDGVWSIPKRLLLTVSPTDVVVGCPGDLNRDGQINAADLVALLSAFGSVGACSSDINGDFAVNSADLVALLSVFGGICE